MATVCRLCSLTADSFVFTVKVNEIHENNINVLTAKNRSNNRTAATGKRLESRRRLLFTKFHSGNWQRGSQSSSVWQRPKSQDDTREISLIDPRNEGFVWILISSNAQTENLIKSPVEEKGRSDDDTIPLNTNECKTVNTKRIDVTLAI